MARRWNNRDTTVDSHLNSPARKCTHSKMKAEKRDEILNFVISILAAWTMIAMYYNYRYSMLAPIAGVELTGKEVVSHWIAGKQQLAIDYYATHWNDDDDGFPSIASRSSGWHRKCETCAIQEIKFTVPNEELCSRRAIDVVYLINSHPGNGMKRQAIRRTWGSAANMDALRMTYVFVLGTTENATLDDVITGESDAYADIVRSTIKDRYANLNLKTLSGFEWATAHCAHARHVFKTDDDMVINVFSVRTLLEKRRLSDKRLILGNCFSSGFAHRNPLSKWYASYRMYPHRFYGAFCLGSGLIMGTRSAGALLRAARAGTHYFPVEDVYISALAASRARVARESVRGLHMSRVNLGESCALMESSVGTLVAEVSDIYTLWNRIRAQNCSNTKIE